MCMHSYLLSKTTKGKVSISDEGDCIRIYFGNIILIQSYESLLGFFENVQNCYANVQHDAFCERRDICFATKIQNMFLQFSAKEICELHALLEAAIIKYELNV